MSGKIKIKKELDKNFNDLFVLETELGDLLDIKMSSFFEYYKKEDYYNLEVHQYYNLNKMIIEQIQKYKRLL